MSKVCGGTSYSAFSKGFWEGCDGTYWITVWSFAHLLFGFIFWWLGISLFWTTTAQLIWELFENSYYGLKWLEHMATLCTHMMGSKPWTNYNGDCIGNSYFDTFSVMVGWFIADWIWGPKTPLL